NAWPKEAVNELTISNCSGALGSCKGIRPEGPKERSPGREAGVISRSVRRKGLSADERVSGEMTEDRLSHLTNRHNLAGGAKADCFPGHTEYDTGFFVFNKRLRAVFLHRQESFCSIAAHSCQQNADSVLRCDPGDGVKQNVDAGTLVMNRRAVLNPRHV